MEKKLVSDKSQDRRRENLKKLAQFASQTNYVMALGFNPASAALPDPAATRTARGLSLPY